MAAASPSISADGRFVAFDSDASNLVRTDTKRSWNVFVYDRSTRKTRIVRGTGPVTYRVSLDPSISAHGRFVAFITGAGRALVYDRSTRRARPVSVTTTGVPVWNSYEPSISANGRFVAFASRAKNLVPNDTNITTDVFVRGPLR